MAAELAGTAAIRLVPSLTNFRSRAQQELARQRGLHVDVDIRPKINTATAQRQLERFRAKEQADAINLKVKVDENEFKRSFQRVEHVFERSAFAKAFRLQIKVLGLDALAALTGAAASAATALDTVVKSAAILPGALSAAGVAAGVFALALGDVGKAMTAVQTAQDQAADKARAFAGAQQDSVRASRDVERAHADVGRAIRTAIRQYEDLAHAVRGTSLDEADALLNVQESFDRLAEGGFKSLTELRRAQLQYAQDLHALDGVRTQNKRTLEDFNEAQRQGVSQNTQVVSALDAVADAQNRVADAANRMADANQSKLDVGAFARLSPSAKEFVTAVTQADGAWQGFQQRMQEGVFAGQAQNLLDTLNISLNNLGPGLDRVAGQIGGVFQTLGAVLRTPQNQNFLEGIIGNTAATIETMRRGLDPLITGFLRMSDVGSRHLPQLADLFNRLFERFNAWTEKIAADGTMDRWITRGIQGLESLVNTGVNLVGILSDIAEAWRLAGGAETGMIQNAEDLTAEIRNWTSSTQGQGSLINFFRDLRGWISSVSDSIREMWPTIRETANAIREWSAWFLSILSVAVRVTAWVQEHTGLVKILLGVYLTFRTVKPIWDTLTNAATLYSNVLQRLAAGGGPLSGFARNSVNGLAQVQTAMGKTGTSAQTMVSVWETAEKNKQAAVARTAETVKRNAANISAAFTGTVTPADMSRKAIDNVAKVNPALQAALTGTVASLDNTRTASTNLGNQLPMVAQNMKDVGDKAAGAAGKVGTGKGVGLLGAASGLMGFLGPMAIAMVATGGIIWAIDKLGEAHRKAAAEAQAQQTQLESLRATLDQFTGAFTPQTAVQTAESAQKYTIPGLGERNIFQDLQRTGLPFSNQQLVAATNPVNQALRDQMLGALEAQTRGRIEATDIWREHGQWLQANGIDINTLTLALSGDPTAKGKFEALPKSRMETPPGGGDTFEVATPDLTQIAQAANIPDSLTTSIFLRDQAGSFGAGGFNRQQASAAAFGTRTFKPGVDTSFFGPNPEVHSSGPNTATIVTSIPATPSYIENFPSDIGSVTDIGGRAQITLTPKGVEHYLTQPAFADGGLIHGRGSGTSDSNLIRASRGEYIIRKAAVDALGVQRLDAINHGLPGFAPGGLNLPFPLKPPTPAPPPPPVLNTPPPPLPGTANTTPYTPTVPDVPTTTIPEAPASTTTVPQVPTAYPPVSTQPTTQMPFSPAALPPSRFPGVEAGLQPNTLSSLRAISAQFPFITDIGGVRPDELDWHPSGKALDIMLPTMAGKGNNDPTDPVALQQGNMIWAWMSQNAERLGIDMGASLWQTKDHYNHIHLATTGSGPGSASAGPGNFAGLPGWMPIGAVPYDPYNPTVQYGANGQPMFSPSGTTASQPVTWESLPGVIAGKYQEALKPENVNKFLLGQAQNVGSSLLAIGFSFLQGMTGIDLSGLFGHGQSIAQHFLGQSGSSSSGDQTTLQPGSPMDQQLTNLIPGAGGFDPMAGLNLNSVVGGAAGVNPSTTTHGTGTGAGVAQWEQLIRQIATKLEAEGMIPPGSANAYVEGVKRQMQFESKGDPNAINPKDSDGLPALGLMQFKQGTFDAHVPPGFKKDPMDPASAIAAAIMYAKANGGPSYLTGQHGYARGGRAASNLIRVSRGEYRMNPAAVARHGVGFMNYLNSFEGGGPVPPPGLPGPGRVQPFLDPAGTQQAMQRPPGIQSFLSMPPLNDPRYIEDRLQPNTLATMRAVRTTFPGIPEIGGYWPTPQGTPQDHPTGRGLDIRVPGGSTRDGRNPEGLAYTQQVYDYLMANKDKYGFRYMLWQTDKGGDHFDHIHVGFAHGGHVQEDPRSKLMPPTSGSALPSIMAGVQEGASLASGYAQEYMNTGAITLPTGQIVPGFAGGGLNFPTGVVINPKPIIPRPPVIPPAARVPAQKMIPKAPAPRPQQPSPPRGQPPKPGPAGPGPAPHVGTGAPPGPPPVPGVPAPTPGPVAPHGMAPGADRSLSMMPGAPTRGSGDYLNPAIRQGLEEGFSHAGALAGAAAGGAMGGMGIPGGGAASFMIAQGAQVAGKIASGVANIASAALIGNFTEIGTQDTPSGVPLLPQIQSPSFGQLPTQQQMHGPKPGAMGGQTGPLIMNVYNGGIHTSNLDEWNRRQQRMQAQQEQPLTNAFVH